MNSIIKLDSGKKGQTLAIFCGIHGNEKAGIYAVNKILETIKIEIGTVFFVYGNPKAIEKNVRYTEKNLNRCFYKTPTGQTYEDQRAQELIQILNQSDALLDVHASNTPKTTPFIITDTGLDIVKNMNFKIIATGFDDIEPGATDGYMKNQGKIGICLECGYLGDSENNANLAYESILQFLKHFKAINQKVPTYHHHQKILKVDHAQLVTSNHFQITRTFEDFETLKKGTLIAKDESTEFITDSEKVILFATPNKPIGAEAYILGNWINK